MYIPVSHSYYCGIDLHARTMYVCILDKDGKKVYHKNIHAILIDFFKPLSLFARILSLALNAFSAGTGWPIYASKRGSILY
jgi:hypothetical protein